MRAWEFGVLGELSKSRKLQERRFRWEQQQAAVQLREAQMGPMERGFRDYQRTQVAYHQAYWNTLTPAQQRALLVSSGAPPIATRSGSEVTAEILAGFGAVGRWLGWVVHRRQRRV